MSEEVSPQVRIVVDCITTHTTCDFDSLAAAVGLSKLWRSQGRQNVYVFIPSGLDEKVKAFLALHKHLFPIKQLKWVADDVESGKAQVGRVGIVDCQTSVRIGPAAQLLDLAALSQGEVFIYDHHVFAQSDIEATTRVVERVGAATTLVVELLMQAGVELTDVEATLFALGIHEDTGSLTYDSATPRDATALAHLMAQGASQVWCSELPSHTRDFSLRSSRYRSIATAL
jgi:tRNA nucleotidyltransferase (CCA-adding enzyme)